MITGQRPDVSAERRYTIAETCSILGIHRHTLTKYTEQGLISALLHKAGGRMYYTGKEIIRFWNAVI